MQFLDKNGRRRSLNVASEAYVDAAASSVSVLSIQRTSLTAKGDVLTATSAGMPAGLPVGVNGQVLTADSGESTGIKWATPSSGAFSLTSYEANLGDEPLYSGYFQITGLSGLSANGPVLIQQSPGPYTGKGDLADEAEMDILSLTAIQSSSTTIDVYWNCPPKMGPVAGNFKFRYATAT